MAAVVADNGSGTCNTEFAGDDALRVELPSIIDRLEATDRDLESFLRMLGYALVRQPTVIFESVFVKRKVNAWICAQSTTDRVLRRKSECLDTCTSNINAIFDL